LNREVGGGGIRGSSGPSGFELRGTDCSNGHGRSLQSSRYRERLEKEKRGRGKWPNPPAVRVATPHYIRKKKKNQVVVCPFPSLSHCHTLGLD